MDEYGNNDTIDSYSIIVTAEEVQTGRESLSIELFGGQVVLFDTDATGLGLGKLDIRGGDITGDVVTVDGGLLIDTQGRWL